jgi:hypothetical protein
MPASLVADLSDLGRMSSGCFSKTGERFNRRVNQRFANSFSECGGKVAIRTGPCAASATVMGFSQDLLFEDRIT